MTLVKDINEFRTLPVRGLDRQLLWQLNQLFPNLLVSIEDLNIKPGEGLFPYCQPSVKKALENLLKDYGKPLTINNAYRSVVAQTVLYNNRGSNLVGKPGKSDHQRGISLDVGEWADVKDLMKKQGWEWTYGDQGSRDVWHFDWHRHDMPDIREDTVKAFQILWNKANPELEQLKVDGDIGEDLSVSKTLKCINDSPAEGFANVGYPRTLKLTEPIQEGKDIGELQLALRKAGIKLEKADQVFSPVTDQAVKDFQRSHSLTIDGVVSAEGETRQALKPYLG